MTPAVLRVDLQQVPSSASTYSDGPDAAPAPAPGATSTVPVVVVDGEGVLAPPRAPTGVSAEDVVAARPFADVARERRADGLAVELERCLQLRTRRQRLSLLALQPDRDCHGSCDRGCAGEHRRKQPARASRGAARRTASLLTRSRFDQLTSQFDDVVAHRGPPIRLRNVEVRG